jgi:ABC-type nitrate/sulfonate/bicarbonate transport system permease component
VLVILPGALPEILTGLRIGLGVGWSTLVAAELIAATRGLGFMVQSAGEFLATDVVLAGIAVIAIIAFLLELGLRAAASPDALAWRNTMSERLTITPLGPYIGAQVSGRM